MRQVRRFVKDGESYTVYDIMDSVGLMYSPARQRLMNWERDAGYDTVKLFRPVDEKMRAAGLLTSTSGNEEWQSMRG